MRTELRQTVQRRYDFRCGYCGVRDTDAGAKLTIDHFQPRAHGGTDDLDNLVYCCHPCNEYKSVYWTTDENLSLIHPVFERLDEHIQPQRDGMLLALTERGANHIAVLHLNRNELITKRLDTATVAQLLVSQNTIIESIREVERQTRDIAAKVNKLFGDPEA